MPRRGVFHDGNKLVLWVRLALVLKFLYNAVFSPCRDGLEDPLDDTGLVQQQLDQLSTIGRCEYEKTCALLVQLFDQSAQTFQELLQSATASPMDIAVQEGECTPKNSGQGALISLPLPKKKPTTPKAHFPNRIISGEIQSYKQSLEDMGMWLGAFSLVYAQILYRYNDFS